MACKPSSLPEGVVRLEGPGWVSADSGIPVVEVGQDGLICIDPLLSHMNEPEPKFDGLTFLECVTKIEAEVPTLARLIRYAVDEVLAYQYSEVDGFNFDARQNRFADAAANELALVEAVVDKIGCSKSELKTSIDQLKHSLMLVSRRYELSEDDNKEIQRFMLESNETTMINEKLEGPPEGLNEDQLELYKEAQEAQEKVLRYRRLLADRTAERNAERAQLKRNLVLSRFSNDTRFTILSDFLSYYFSTQCKSAIESAF